MTYGELAEYAKEQMQLTMTEIIDYRPAGGIYIDDIAFPLVYKGKDYVNIPNGIRFWLANGDSIIYVKKLDKGNEKSDQQ